ncbi:protein D3-like isoform X1 [Acropora millepora]|uniref:protein D3-like isoform X1 n=1 Tax=Acropora millepora TaxID=45264 RepID=UPI001CF4EF9E|nr:protein D3-like isoform X1 [Acropora millepora]
MDTYSFGFVYFALSFAQTKGNLNLLEDSHFNHQASCEDYRYDGMRLLFAKVVIGGKVFDKMNCGEAVPLDDVTRDIPVVKFSQNNESLYLVAMLDPDTPSFLSPLCRHWVHFIFGNVKGKYLANGEIRGGNIYGEYNPPNPQPGQGVHRFYFFVFEQEEKLVDGIQIANRCGFDIDGFMSDFGLKPVAMNMFRSEFQSGVLINDMMIL